ncbi:MAG TPA: cyclic nucleotide-binding domain-containing protein [Byssovorax sp.]|jgi:CRP-like cAMP-binding protein
MADLARTSALPEPSSRFGEDNEELGVLERRMFMRQLMPVATAATAAQLARSMRDARYAKGDLVYARGTPPRDIVFLVRGSVELRAPGEPPWSFEAPALIGAIDALHDRPHARDAFATTDVSALALRSEEWWDVLEDHFEVAMAGFRRTSEDLWTMRVGSPPDGGFDPPAPRGQPTSGLNVVERMRLLRGAGLFAAATVQSIARIAAVADEVEIAPGGGLCREGERSERVFVVASGHVEIRHASPEIVARFGPGQIVGGACAAGLGECGWTATAVTPVVALSVRREDLLDVMEDHSELTRSIMMGVSVERERMLAALARREAELPPGPRAV